MGRKFIVRSHNGSLCHMRSRCGMWNSFRNLTSPSRWGLRKNCHGTTFHTKKGKTRHTQTALTMKRSRKKPSTVASQLRQRLVCGLKLFALRNMNWIMKVMRAAATARKTRRSLRSSQGYDRRVIPIGESIASSVDV